MNKDIKPPLGLVLAGGKSTRMGAQDKALLHYNRDHGPSMTGHAVDRLAKQVDQVVINTNAELTKFDDVHDRVAGIVPDSIQGYAGPLAGVLAGLDFAAQNGWAQVVTVSVDAPFFPTDLVQRLQAVDAPIVIAKSTTGEKGRNLQPTFGLWHVSLRDELRLALGDGMRKVMAFVERYDWQSVEWDTGKLDYFFNVNTPQDLALAKTMMQEFEGGA